MSNQKTNQTLDVNDALAQSEAFVIKYKKQIIAAAVAVCSRSWWIHRLYLWLFQAPRRQGTGTARSRDAEVCHATGL